jgi:hypothetical protein
MTSIEWRERRDGGYRLLAQVGRPSKRIEELQAKTGRGRPARGDYEAGRQEK